MAGSIGPERAAKDRDMGELLNSWKMDRSQFSIGSLADQARDRDYWMTRDPAERLAAIELFRQIYYGYDPATTRLQRVYSISQFREG